MTIQMRHCVRAAQRGDKIAAEELIKAFKPYLHHQAKKYQRFYQNFDEALSTAYHGAVDCIYQYDLSQFEETVTEVMVASVHNHLRRESYSRTCYYQRVEKTIMENDTLTDLPEDLISENACPERCYLEDEVRTQLYWALEQLPELQQTFIRLHFIHGYSYQQIAKKYNLQKSTICGYIKRGLRNLKIQQQTLQRVKDDLGHFCICGENDAMKFTENALAKPVIIVLKKNYRVLRQWANIMRSTAFMVGNPLFILDDEADAASLNTLVNSHRQSSINRYLYYIKNEASSSIYLQVTGTPQAIFLQTLMSGFRPYFTYYFKPGKGYLGGDFFFSETGKDCIRVIDRLKEPLRQAVFHHLVVSAQLLKSGEAVSNFMIHPSVRMNVHNKYKKEVENILHEICTDFENEEVQLSLKEAYNRLHPKKHELLPFEDIREEVQELLDNHAIKVLIMNGKHEVDAEEYAAGSNILIGGNTLGRGVTFGGLHTIFYTRTAKKPQADTMWQHSRMFGYDRDPGMIELYLDNRLYKLFCDINATNDAIIAQIERGIENVKMYYPEELSPTRKNVLDKRHVFAVSGGTNYFPLEPSNHTIEDLDKLLQPFNDHEEKYQVSMQIIKKILEHIQTEPEFPIGAFLSFINIYIARNPGAQAILIVRRERDIKKGSGALLSPNDWKLGNNITDKMVLTVYKMTGNKGWDGQKIWVPNIKLPDNAIYYDVAEADE